MIAPGMGYRFPGRCHVGCTPGRRGAVVVDLSKDDLIAIEHALTREYWHAGPVADLLLRVRLVLLNEHDHRTVDAPPKDYKVVEPKPKGEGWPNLRSS